MKAVDSSLGHAALMILDIGLKLDASTPPLAFISSMACFIPWLITMLVIAGLARHGEQGADVDNVRILRLFGSQRR